MLRFKASTLIVLLSIVFASCGNNKNKQTDETSNAKPAEIVSVGTETSVKEKNILFFGTSLTAGYGLEQGEAYPELLQKKLDSLKLRYKAINGGLSGET